MKKPWIGFLVFGFAALMVEAAEAGTPLKVMNFNTMCDTCDLKKDYGPFRKRIRNIADTIARHDPDLASLQEFRTKRQIKRVSKMLGSKYELVFAKGFPLSYADPVLFIRKGRFKILDCGAGWLGPNYPRFSFGWRFKIPRRFQWVKLHDLKSGVEFIFVGTHFDNSFANKDKSAVFANDFFSRQSVPVLFAGDSNLKPEHGGYAALVGQNMRDTFHEAPGGVEFFTNLSTPINKDDGCNKSKGRTFPECRIDHVLVSADAPWNVQSWGVDLYRYHRGRKFVSDHRAVIVELE